MRLFSNKDLLIDIHYVHIFMHKPSNLWPSIDYMHGNWCVPFMTPPHMMSEVYPGLYTWMTISCCATGCVVHYQRTNSIVTYLLFGTFGILLLTEWPLGCDVVILRVYLPNTCYRLISRLLPMECNRTPLMITQQVMAWRRHTTIHYLGQCLPRSKSPCGVI